MGKLPTRQILKNIDFQHKEVLWKFPIQNHVRILYILMPLVKSIHY